MLLGKIGSPINWMGGKFHLASEIVRRIPAHRTYVEPFAGALHVLFRKPPSPHEVVNDVNDNLVNLWLCIRDRLEDVKRYLEGIPIAESLFNQFMVDLWYTSQDPSGIPCRDLDEGKGIPGLDQDMQERYTNPSGRMGIPSPPGIPDLDPGRAAKYYYLVRCAFNGEARAGATFAHGKKIPLSRDDWAEIAARLQGVTITCRDFAGIITLYDAPDSFFYLDPPYFCAVGGRYYEHVMSGPDHERLRDILRTLKGKFLLSLDNTDEARDLYADFRIETVPVRYTERGELLVSNFETTPENPFYFPSHVGIPSLEEGYTCEISERYTPPGPASFDIPNCPGCRGRNVQKYYLRHTKPNKQRTFKAAGLRCMDCGRTFRL